MADASVRMAEASWLRSTMVGARVNNSYLHRRLVNGYGWVGQLNNVASWRSGSCQIPDRVLPWIVEILDPTDSIQERRLLVAKLFACRYPYLAPFLIE